MYRSLFYRLLPIRQIKKECLLKVVDWSPEPIAQKWSRHLTTSAVCYKKRKSVEERAVENTGRKVIRYSPKAGTEVVGIWRNMTVSDLAGVLKKDVEHVYKALEFADKTSNIDYREDTVLHNPQVVRDVVKISGCRFKIVPRPDQDLQEEENKDAVPAPPAPEHALRPRPPVACVMGHVDHGKTTLLDALRDTAVVDQEFGGITQHIGAFQVRISSGDTVTFLDTPGHAAFSAMRARGAGVTDLVVLVVAADDGVMDQTTESIRMARQADVPILVAVNKMDKPGANIDKVLRSLSTVGVVCEALGGDVQAVPVSALRRTGLDHLIDALVLQAQLMDLKADPTGYVEGVVIEAQLDTRTGKQATVLVQRGTLRRGCVLVAGGGWAKVRVLQSADGTSVAEAGPGTPVAVLGWRDLPAAGDLALEVASEKRAGEVMRWRRAARMRDKQAGDEGAIAAKEAQHQAAYKEQVAKRRAAGRFRMRREGPREKMIRDDGHPTLSVLIKGDVDGSVEALVELLDTYEDHDRVRLTLVHAGVGPPTPSDVEMAEAFKAILYTFNVETPPAVAAEAKTRAVPVKQHNVIYRLIDDVKQEISNRIPVTQEELILGEANVLQQFQVSEGRKKVPVAGCRCVRGSLRRERYRLLRAGELLYDGKLASMKHLKEEVTSIKRDMECGLRLEDPSVEVRPGDTLVCYTLVDKRPDTDWDPGF